MNPRLLAVRILEYFFAKQCSLTQALQHFNDQIQKSSQPGLVQELCYGVTRWYIQLDAIAHQLITKPLKAKDEDVHLLILLGLYQLQHLRIPDHAVINETVAIINNLKKPWAKGLVNAVLRNFQRQRTELLANLKKDYEAHYAHPDWFIKIIKAAWPQHWQDILGANNERPPFTLRVNLAKTSRADYLTLLQNQNITAIPCKYSAVGIRLENAVDVHALPRFNEGFVSVQDEAAQLAAQLLDLKPNMRVLDACAAPGGKTAHILETEPSCEVIAVDLENSRLTKVTENLSRLQLKAQLIAADASEPNTWWDGRLFDRILLDAPCSATGVIRRHPDIKLLKTDADIPNLAALQFKLLTALWPLLKPNGLMVYATCSVLPTENSELITTFLAAHSDATELKIEANWGIIQPHGRQILPTATEMDGFFYCCLQKLSLS